MMDSEAGRVFLLFMSEIQQDHIIFSDDEY